MSDRRDGRLVPLLPPAILGLAIVAAAPFWGSLALPRLRGALGREGMWTLMTVVLVAAFVVLIGFAWRRLSQPADLSTGRRCALLVGAIVLVGLQIVTGSRAEAAVERIHLVIYGLLALLVVRSLGGRSGWWALPIAWLAATTTGIVDEFVQWFVPVRTGDLFDVGLNTWAALVGALAGCALYPPSRAQTRSASSGGRRLLLLWSAVALVLAAVVLHNAHLGYRIEDPEVGTFQSFFRADRLQELDRSRTTEWTAQRPGPLRALEREDYFRTEAGWHVRARNRFREAGELESAWREDRILRRYYGAFLEIRRPNGEYKHRIPEQEFAELEGRFGGTSAADFLSRADNGRIWIRPSKPELWLTIGLVSVLLLFAASRRPPPS